MSNNVNVKFRADASAYDKGIQKIKNSTNAAGRAAKQTTSSYSGWFKGMKKHNSMFTNLNRDGNRASKTMVGLGKAMKFTAALAIVRQIGVGFAAIVQASMDAIETNNLFVVSLGEMESSAQGVVDTLSDAYGLDPTNIKSAMGTFALLGKSMGMVETQAETLATQTYQLGLDLSSLTNVPINQVMSDLKSGLVGQSETVYKYGMDVTEAGLKAQALSEGITKSVRNMTQGEKMVLRYNAMMEQGKVSFGDFAKTINSPANQAKILTERIVTLSRSLGNIFIPMLTAVLPYVNMFVAGLTSMANAIAAFFGYEAETFGAGATTGLDPIIDDADSATDAVGGTTDAVKKLNASIMGIDELNIMNAPTDMSSGGGGASAGGGGGVADMDLTSKYDIMGEMSTKTKNFIENMKKAFEPLGTSLSGLWESLKKLYPTAKQIWDEVFVPLGQWVIGKGLPELIDYISGLVSFLAEHPDLAGTLTATAIALTAMKVAAAHPSLAVIATIVLSIEAIEWAGGRSVQDAVDTVFNKKSWEDAGVGIGDLVAQFFMHGLIDSDTWEEGSLFDKYVDWLMKTFDVDELGGLVMWKEIGNNIANVMWNGFVDAWNFFALPIEQSINEAAAGLGIDFTADITFDKVEMEDYYATMVKGQDEAKVAAAKLRLETEKLQTGQAILFGTNGMMSQSFATLTGKTDKQKQSFNFLGDSSWNAGRKIVESVNNQMLPAVNGASTGISGAATSINGSFGSVGTGATTTGSTVYSAFNNTMIPVFGASATALSGATGSMTTNMTGMGTTAGTATDTVKTSFAGMPSAIAGYLETMRVSVDSKSGQTRDLLISILNGGTATVTGSFGSMVNHVTQRMLDMASNSKIALLKMLDDMGMLPKRTDQASVNAAHNALLSSGRPAPMKMFANGGIMTSPTVGMMGEAGDEAVIPLSPDKIAKYFEPVFGNNSSSKDYDAMYKAMDAALSKHDKSGDNVYTIYIDGVYKTTIKDINRKNVRSGKIVIPIGG